MSHIKTWDVEPPVDAVPTRADLSSQKPRLPEGEGVPEAALPLELARREMAKLRELYVAKLLTLAEFDAGLRAAVDHVRCQSKACYRMADFRNDHGYLICARCFNAGCRCPGCEQDRAWQAYKEPTE